MPRGYLYSAIGFTLSALMGGYSLYNNLNLEDTLKVKIFLGTLSSGIILAASIAAVNSLRKYFRNIEIMEMVWKQKLIMFR